MIQQLRYLRLDCRRMVKGSWWRYVALPFSPGFACIGFYRIDRGCWSLLGSGWAAIRLLLSPILAIMRPWIGGAVNYRADIGPGFVILHPSLGVVVSAHVTAGSNLTLVGGNLIGTRPDERGPSRVLIGNDVEIGALAVLLGPVRIGDRVMVGAHSVVTNDVATDSTVVGVPARPIRRLDADPNPTDRGPDR